MRDVGGVGRGTLLPIFKRIDEAPSEHIFYYRANLSRNAEAKLLKKKARLICHTR